jgi:hypothetical protein
MDRVIFFVEVAAPSETDFIFVSDNVFDLRSATLTKLEFRDAFSRQLAVDTAARAKTFLFHTIYAIQFSYF